jgi:hypothetical protein
MAPNGDISTEDFATLAQGQLDDYALYKADQSSSGAGGTETIREGEDWTSSGSRQQAGQAGFDSSTVSDEKMAEYREAFNQYGKDGDGQMTFLELQIVMRTFNSQISDLEVQQLLEKFDTDDSGSIEFEEWWQMIWSIRSNAAYSDWEWGAWDERPAGYETVTTYEYEDKKDGGSGDAVSCTGTACAGG